MPYYQSVEFDPKLVEAYVILLNTVRDYRAAGLLADAARVDAAIAELQAGYKGVSERGAIKATAFVRDRLRQTAVRPPTSGNLERAIVSRPLPPVAGAFQGGSIGIADIDELDRGAVNPRTGGIYWRSQEWGLPVLTDQRPAPGYFMDAYGGGGTGSAPNAAEFRLHPYFQQFAYSRGMPALVRKRALRARHFLSDGVRNYVYWHAREAQRVRSAALTRLARR